MNILCTTRFGGSFQPITGSGILIDNEVILTNAHLAQYVVIEEALRTEGSEVLECMVRAGSPATNIGEVSTLYIPDRWVSAHAEDLTKETPLGTGEYDFALLRLHPKKTSPPLLLESLAPLSFSTNESDIELNGSIIMASYPAGFLGGIAIQRDLYMLSATSQIEKFYTFHEDTLDLIALGSTVLAQQGSSGGGVVDLNTGKLIGVIVTRSEGDTTDERTLRAISIPHIERTLADESLSLSSYVQGNIDLLQASFKQNKFADSAATLLEALQ